MSSLGFDLLDRHVVHGRGDDIACTDDSGSLTYAQLLERTAALAGGLRALGVKPGDEAAITVQAGNLQVLVVCACVRLGAVPAETGALSIVESADGVSVRIGDEEHDLDLVSRVGKTDPAPSLPSDPPGYRQRVSESFGHVVAALG